MVQLSVSFTCQLVELLHSYKSGYILYFMSAWVFLINFVLFIICFPHIMFHLSLSNVATLTLHDVVVFRSESKNSPRAECRKDIYTTPRTFCKSLKSDIIDNFDQNVV